MVMTFKKIILWIVLISLILGVSYGAGKLFYGEDTISVHVEKEIENSIEMKELQNQFVVIDTVGFGGAGAGGQGTAQMKASSAQQFIEIIKNTTKEEWIWSTEMVEVGYSTFHITDIYTKVYWSFIKDRAGILIYEKKYSYPGYTIKLYDKEAGVLYFYKNNWSYALVAVVIVFFVCLFLWSKASESCFYKWHINKWEQEYWKRKNKK